MDCMHPTSLAKGSRVIQEGDDGSTVYVLEGKTKMIFLLYKYQTVKAHITLSQIPKMSNSDF